MAMNVRILPALCVAALTLAGCGDKSELPEGQVVATIDGKDVTIHELNSEMQLVRTGPETSKKLIEQVSLARILERKMLAEEARKAKLEATPQFLLSRARAEDGLLVQALQGKIESEVSVPTREAAQKFVEENPAIFSNRRIFTIDQIQFLRPPTIDKLPLAAAKTMGDVEQVLTGAGIEFRRAPQQVDTLTINPQLTAEITRLSGSANPEPFMFIDQPANASGPVVFINNVTSTKTQPFTGEKAINYAKAVLQQQGIQKRLASELERIKADYKSKIVYAKGYSEPDPKLMAAAGAAPAKPAGAAAGPAAAGPAAGAPAAAVTAPSAAPAAPAPASPAAAAPAP